MKIASDCKSVVADIIIGILGPIRTVIVDINDTKGEFESYFFVHVGHSSNMEAHHLSKHALQLSVGCHLYSHLKFLMIKIFSRNLDKKSISINNSTS